MGDTLKLAAPEVVDYDFDPGDVDILDLDVLDFRDTEGLVYPAILLSGVLFSDCLKVLNSKKRKSYREVDTWVELPDAEGFTHIGTIQLDSEILLLLRHLGIIATLYISSEEIQVLDLHDPEVLERFL